MKTSFLQPGDYLTFISEEAFRKLLRNNDNKLILCESNAAGYVIEKLSGRFEIYHELQKEGEVRNRELARWIAVITVYNLYQSVPDDEIPERIRQNYEDVLKEINKVASGRDNSTLKKATDNTGKSRTSFRWTSNPRRSHNPFS